MRALVSSFLLAVAFVAVALVAPLPRAAACTGQFEMAAQRPGTAVFDVDGSGLWVLTERGSWTRIEESGQRQELPVGAPVSRLVASAAGTLVLVHQGLMYPSCDFDWHRIDRVELRPARPPPGTAGPTLEGNRVATPRLHDFPAIWSLGISPGAGRVAAASYDRLAVVDFASRDVLRTIEVDRAMVVWLDDDHLAWLGPDGLHVLSVRDGSRAEPIAVSSPFEAGEPIWPTGAEALLPGHPSCGRGSEPRVAVLDADSSPAALTLVAISEDGCDEWRLMRVHFAGDGPRVEPAIWAGAGHLLALSASGTRVAVLRGRTVEVLDRETGQSVARVTARWSVIGASLAADGLQLVVASRRPVRRDPEDYDEEHSLARGGRGELGVEAFHLHTRARRRLLGRAPPSRLRIVAGRP